MTIRRETRRLPTGLGLAHDERYRGLDRLALVAQHRLNPHGHSGDIRRGLHLREVGRAGEDQFDGIKNARDVSLLFEVETGRDTGAYRIAVRSNADQHFVLPRFQRGLRIEVARGETRQMIPEQLPVQKTRVPNMALCTLMSATAGTGCSN